MGYLKEASGIYGEVNLQEINFILHFLEFVLKNNENLFNTLIDTLACVGHKGQTGGHANQLINPFLVSNFKNLMGILEDESAFHELLNFCGISVPSMF